jgi:protein-disulfide isomerase
MNKQFFAIIVVIIAGLIGLFALTGGDKNNSGDNGGDSTSEGQVSNHVKGATESKVTLVEYGDFQCPACKSYHPVLQQLEAEYGDRVTFQFRHFPLTQIHPNAFMASRAAEAAGKQGKFFEMHDFLFESQETWATVSNPTSIFESFAQQLELNVEQFKTDMNSAGVAATINADLKAAQAAGGTSTPTFVLNDTTIDNPQSLEDFKKVLDDELAKVQQ